MDQVKEHDEIAEIEIKRPFIPKFIKQLNYQQNQKLRKAKRKQKAQPPISAQKLEKFEQTGLPVELKNSKKLSETTRNGNRIIATWKNDQIHGEAEIHYHNGVTFKGLYQNGIKVKGHFKFLNGYEYIGNCLGNKFYGEGSLIFPSGKIISGDWREYNLTGNGKIEYPKGEVYYGEVHNFKKQGKGYLFFSDGTKYVGEFNNGLITGNGTYYVDDKPVSSGIWMNGELQKSMDLDHDNESHMMGEMQETGQSFISNYSSKQEEKKESLQPEKPEKPQKLNKSNEQQCWEVSQQPPNKKVRFAE